jgi:O-antigen ligase
VLSILAGLGKVSEKDSSICFIGGYNHEAAVSIVILTLLYCACVLERDRPKLTILVMPVAVVSLLLANYRTTLLAALPILAATMFFGTVRRFSPRDRPFIVIVVALVGATIFYAAAIAMQERFSDLLVVLSNGTNLFKPPEYYTVADADLLSARAIIWSRYITAYLNGSITNLAIGFGPETWDELFTTYAHNSFVSVLYEAGIFGLVGLVLLFAWNFGFAARTAWDRRPLAMSAHIGFLVLNLATMPLWLIEGNVLLALTLAYTLHVQAPSTARTPQVRWNASAS